MERDKFLSPSEAKDFGLIDEVVEARPPRAIEAARGSREPIPGTYSAIPGHCAATAEWLESRPAGRNARNSRIVCGLFAPAG